MPQRELHQLDLTKNKNLKLAGDGLHGKDLGRVEVAGPRVVDQNVNVTSVCECGIECLIDGKPTLFDPIEFSDEIATIDVLYDLAFLLMDLHHRGHGELGNRVLNRYLDRTEDEGGLAALPLFLSLRAGIRAHVGAAAASRQSDAGKAASLAQESRAYLALAGELLDFREPRLVAIGDAPQRCEQNSAANRTTVTSTLRVVSKPREERREIHAIASTVASAHAATTIEFTGIPVWAEALSSRAKTST